MNDLDKLKESVAIADFYAQANNGFNSQLSPFSVFTKDLLRCDLILLTSRINKLLCSEESTKESLVELLLTIYHGIVKVLAHEDPNRKIIVAMMKESFTHGEKALLKLEARGDFDRILDAIEGYKSDFDLFLLSVCKDFKIDKFMPKDVEDMYANKIGNESLIFWSTITDPKELFLSYQTYFDAFKTNWNNKEKEPWLGIHIQIMGKTPDPTMD